MKLYVRGAAQLPLLAAGACAVVVGGLCLSSDPVSEWIHESSRVSAVAEARQAPVTDSSVEARTPADSTGSAPRRKGKCTECGIVESARLTESGGTRAVYEITVRLSDRSTRVFSDSDAAKWRPGERIILIGPGSPPAN